MIESEDCDSNYEGGGEINENKSHRKYIPIALFVQQLKEVFQLFKHHKKEEEPSGGTPSSSR